MAVNHMEEMIVIRQPVMDMGVQGQLLVLITLSMAIPHQKVIMAVCMEDPLLEAAVANMEIRLPPIVEMTTLHQPKVVMDTAVPLLMEVMEIAVVPKNILIQRMAVVVVEQVTVGHTVAPPPIKITEIAVLTRNLLIPLMTEILVGRAAAVGHMAVPLPTEIMEIVVVARNLLTHRMAVAVGQVPPVVRLVVGHTAKPRLHMEVMVLVVAKNLLTRRMATAVVAPVPHTAVPLLMEAMAIAAVPHPPHHMAAAVVLTIHHTEKTKPPITAAIVAVVTIAMAATDPMVDITHPTMIHLPGLRIIWKKLMTL